MQLDINQLVALASIVKAGQAVPFGKKRRKPRYDAAYPDYSKSLYGQQRQDPARAGMTRGLTSGTLGAVLGALLARLATDNPAMVGAGAVSGAALGGIPGFQSGRREALSRNSKLLYLRRMGINRPGEQDSLTEYPVLAGKQDEGYQHA